LGTVNWGHPDFFFKQENLIYYAHKYDSIPDLTKKIKDIVDPNGIIAPGRYLPVKR